MPSKSATSCDFAEMTDILVQAWAQSKSGRNFLGFIVVVTLEDVLSIYQDLYAQIQSPDNFTARKIFWASYYVSLFIEVLFEPQEGLVSFCWSS